MSNNWKIAGGAVIGVVLLMGTFAFGHWFAVKQNQPQSPPTVTVSAPPQIIHTNTETVREVAVQAPSTPGAVLQIVERDGKIIAKVGDQEVEVPNQTGQPEVKLGENGELKISTTSTAQIDVTDLANAQAQLIANQALAEQAKVHKAELDKEKAARKKERLLWTVGTVAGGYLLTR